MEDDERQNREREVVDEAERNNILRYGRMLDIDEIMEVVGLSQDVREWVLEGKTLGECSVNIELPGRINSRVISWLRLRENNDRD